MTSNPALSAARTDDAAAAAAMSPAAAREDDLSKLGPYLRFIEIETAANVHLKAAGNKSSSSSSSVMKEAKTTRTTTTTTIHWPCLLFENSTVMNYALSGSSLYPPSRSRQMASESIQLQLQQQLSSKLPVAYLLGEMPPPTTKTSSRSRSSRSSSKLLLPRVIFAPSAARLIPIDDPLITVSCQLEEMFQQDEVNGKFLQSALEEMLQIMRPSQPHDDDDNNVEMIKLHESSLPTTTIADKDGGAVVAPSSSSCRQEEDLMEIDSIKLANDAAPKTVDPLSLPRPPPPAATLMATSLTTMQPPVASTTNQENDAAAAAATLTKAQKAFPPPTKMAAFAFTNLPTWESTATTTPCLKKKANQETRFNEVVTQQQQQQQQQQQFPATDKSRAVVSKKSVVPQQGDATMANAQEQPDPTQGHPDMAPAAEHQAVVATTDKSFASSNSVHSTTTTTPAQEENGAITHRPPIMTEGHKQALKTAPTTTRLPPTLQNNAAPETARHDASTSTTTSAATREKVASPVVHQEEENKSPPPNGDNNDDDMPMADDDDEHEQAVANPPPMDDDQAMKTADESSRKTRTDSGRVVVGMDAASEKESVLVEATTRPTSFGASSNRSRSNNKSSSSSSESVLVQSTRSSTRKTTSSVTSTSKKLSRPKKSSSKKTPSQPTTRSRPSLSPSISLAFGKLGTAKKSSSNRKAPEPSGKKIILPSFSTIKELLQKGGYFFDSSLFCRPFMNPRNNPQAVLGRDYFDSLQAFRQDLCAYGVDDYLDWTVTDRDIINQWVRLTVVKSVNLDKDSWPEHDSLNKADAMRILYQLEYRKKKTPGGADAWYLPSVDPKDGVPGKTMFMDEKSLWDHLYRFGLSANASRDKDDDRKLISLELFLSQPHQHEVNTFERISPPMDDAASAGARTSRKKRSSMSSSGSVYSASTSASSVSASASGSKGNSKKRSIEASSSSSSSVPSKKHASTRATAVATKTPHPPIESTWTPEDSPPPASTKMNLHNSTSTVVTADSFSPRESRTLPVIQGTDKERLLGCIEALNQTNELDHFSYGNGESRFEQNLNRVMTFLNAAITTQGEHGGRPGDPTALYICGVPGIGKTSGIKWCCNKMIQEVEKGTIRVAGNWKPRICEINATRLQNVQNPMKDVIESMGKAMGLSKWTMSNVERKLKQGGLLILVVDEIDSLVSVSKSGNVGKHPASERVVQKLLEWTSNDNMGLAVIGISNSTGNDKFCRLQELGKFKETLTFNAYGVQDIVSILEGRIGRSVMDHNAMQFIGRKISNDSGDARKALKLAAKAVQICLDKLEKTGDKTTPGHLVKTVHAHLANRSSQERLNERIGGLPTFTKGLLCVLSALGHEDAISVTCGRLRGFCASCMSHENDIPTAEDFRVSIETLEEMGLLRFGPGASIMALDSAPVRLGVQSEDVESAILQELGQTPFFMRMRELAQSKRAELLNNE